MMAKTIHIPAKLLDKIPLGSRHRKTFYSAFAALWLTGALWLYFHYFGQTKGPFGPEKSPVEAYAMRVHGLAAMAALLCLGSLKIHVERAWYARLNRISGAAIIGACGLLVVTGWLLYYASDERLRALADYAHWIPGLLFPLGLYWHIRKGRSARPPLARKRRAA